MAWVAPTIRTTGTLITAAIWNQDVVNNALETAPAKVTTKGDLVAATGTNAIARLAAAANGRLLATNSAQSSGLEWKQIVTAKGDLVTATGADALAVLAAGTNGYYLTPDSSQSTGLAWLNPPACLAYKGANQTISNATYTDITLTAEIFDTDTMHDNSTNPERITATRAGKYLVAVQITYTANTVGYRALNLVDQTGASLLSIMATAVAGGHQTTISATTLWNAAASDWVKLRAWQDSGGSLDVAGGGQVWTFIGAVRIAI